MTITWGLRIKSSFFLYAVIFTPLALIVYFSMLSPFVVGYFVICSSTLGIFLSSIWINLPLDRWILDLKERKGWSTKTVKVLKKINNWSLFLIPISIAIIFFYSR